MSHIVNTEWLNLRSEPKVNNENKIAVIPLGHPVTVLNQVTPTWAEIQTSFDGRPLTGYLAFRFLTPTSNYITTQPVTQILEVHREENNVQSTIQSRTKWSYPIGDPNRITRDNSTIQTKKDSIIRIINYLNVETSERYRPATYTYCNIYAHDYAYLCGAYLPRVWWTSTAIADLSQGNSVVPQYGTTIREMNANSIYDWFSDWSDQFGWVRYFDVAEVQKQADLGKVCVCIAKNKQTNRSGHLATVIPVHDSYTTQTIDGRLLPLMSQAGRINKARFNDRWWTHSRFNFFGFWIHD